MFYTPGWGVVLTLTGTLGGVLTTQVVNSAISRGTRRRERHASIVKAVSELIGSGQAWVYAASTQEQDLFRAVNDQLAEEPLMDAMAAARAEVYSAQLAFGSAQAVVRLTCPPDVVTAAENLHRAIQEFENETRAKVEQALEVRSLHGVSGTDPAGVVGPQNQLVKVTRSATGNR